MIKDTNVLWTPPPTLPQEERGLDGHICILASHPISNCQLCDGLGKAAGLQMTVCIMFLFHWVTSFNNVSLKDTAWSLQTNEDSKGQRGRTVSSPRTAGTAAACRGKCAVASRGSWRNERPPRVWNTPRGTLRNHGETFSGVQYLTNLFCPCDIIWVTWQCQKRSAWVSNLPKVVFLFLSIEQVFKKKYFLWARHYTW